MMVLKRIFTVLLMFALAGCVTTKEYNSRLTDIDGLKKDVSSLEEKLKETEAQKKNTEVALSKLQQDFEDLKKQNQALTDANKNLDALLNAKKGELSEKINGLRGKLTEKENELNAKNVEIDSLKKQIAALNQEKENALKEKEKSIAEMKRTYDSLMGEMNQEIKKGEITITQLKDKLSVNLVEQILFDSGSADIKKEGKKVLDRVAEILKKVTDKQVRVEGHTDNVPISRRLQEKFASNWELSTARATMVARYIQDKGIDPKLLSASGYSEYRPISANDTDEGKARNRRIEIALIPKEEGIQK